MAEPSQPDFSSFLSNDMSPSEKNQAYKQAYLNLYEQGLSMVSSLREEKEELLVEQTKWHKQEQFGIKVIEQLRAQLQYYHEKYPNDKPPIANENDDENENENENETENENENGTGQQDDGIAQTVDNIASNDFLSVFANNSKFGNATMDGIDGGSGIAGGIDGGIAGGIAGGIDGGLTGDPSTVSTVAGMRKNLVRLYTKTDWDATDLNDLKEEMRSHMQSLKKERINQMTHNPQIMASSEKGNDRANKQYDSPMNAAKADADKFRRLYQESEAKLEQLQREYSSKMLENEEGIKAMRDMMSEEKEMLIKSKVDFVNAVASEMQHLRDLIRLYNPEEKYRHIIDKIVRYHDLEPGQGNALFQLIQNNAQLPKPVNAPPDAPSDI